MTNEARLRLRARQRDLAAGLAAAQVHAGHLAAAATRAGGTSEGELSPIQRVADVFFGRGLKGLDGTAWFHPQRLTIDAGAVGDGNANPAQAVLDVHATHGADLRACGSTRSAPRSAGGGCSTPPGRWPTSPASRHNVTLVDRHDGYSHVDPVTADPHNDFVDNLTPFLGRIGGGSKRSSDERYVDPAGGGARAGQATLSRGPERQDPRLAGVLPERRRPESNRCTRLCRPLRSRRLRPTSPSATRKPSEDARADDTP